MKSARQKKIIDLLMRDGFVKTSELQSSLGVSIETIRRDFNQLEKEGILIKTYGGATWPSTAGICEAGPGYLAKADEYFRPRKTAIALRAIEYIKRQFAGHGFRHDDL